MFAQLILKKYLDNSEIELNFAPMFDNSVKHRRKTYYGQIQIRNRYWLNDHKNGTARNCGR